MEFMSRVLELTKEISIALTFEFWKDIHGCITFRMYGKMPDINKNMVKLNSERRFLPKESEAHIYYSVEVMAHEMKQLIERVKSGIEKA